MPRPMQKRVWRQEEVELASEESKSSRKMMRNHSGLTQYGYSYILA